MHRILQDILKNTDEEVKKREKNPLSEDFTLYPHLPFRERILNSVIGDIGLIAEIKLASPTMGKLGEEGEVENRLKEYQHAGADAVSVITEERTFKGSLGLVTTIKNAGLSLPILQKDFIRHEFQIKESSRLGADALLLIARIVNDRQLKRFVKLCREVGLEPVVEIYNEDDLEKAIGSGTEIIAVNARDLDTFEVNIDSACKLLKKIPQEFIKLGFSGIHSRAEVEKYKQTGATAVLVGIGLMQTNDITRLIKELKSAS